MYNGTVYLILALKVSTLRSGSELCSLWLTKLERPMLFSDASKKYSLSGYLGREKDCWIRRTVSSRLVGFLHIVSLMILNEVKDLMLGLTHNSQLERFLAKSKQCCLRILNTNVLILMISDAFSESFAISEDTQHLNPY